MKCPACGAYIPDGLHSKQCFECNAFIEESVGNEVRRNDAVPSNSAKEEAFPADVQKQMKEGEGCKRIVLTKYDFFCKVATAYSVAAIFSGGIGISSAMRMDSIFGVLVMAPILIPLWLVLIALSFMLLFAVRDFSVELKRNNLLYAAPIALVLGEFVSFFIFSPWGALIIPLWLFVLGNGYASTSKSQKLQGQARVCPKCGASNNKILWNCWECKYELIPRPHGLIAASQPGQAAHVTSALESISIYTLIGLLLFGFTVMCIFSGSPHLTMAIFGMIPAAMAVFIDKATIDHVGFVFFTCGFLFWGMIGAVIGTAFIDKVSLTRKQVILSATISLLVLLWMASAIYLGQKTKNTPYYQQYKERSLASLMP